MESVSNLLSLASFAASFSRTSPRPAAIAGRYLGAEAGRRFAAERTKPGVVVRLATPPRAWDLSAILPS